MADAMVDATREGGGAEVTAVLSLTQQATVLATDNSHMEDSK